LVAPSNPKTMGPGSIADTVAHLALWAGRPTRALARVEYHSEYTRVEVARRLGEIARRENIPFHEIQLPSRRSPSEVLRTLLEILASLEPGVVSIAGFATACADAARANFLGALASKREKLAEFNLRQIWWMTPDFADAFIRTVPALDSWFFPRLQLRETFTPATKGPSRREASAFEGPSYGLDDALRRATSLVERFRRAKKTGARPSELMELAVWAADAIVEVGAPDQTKELADQFLAEAIALLPDPTSDTDSTVPPLISLARLLTAQGRMTEAEPLVDRALALANRRDGHDQPDVARDLNSLACLLDSMGRPVEDAERFFRRALEIYERTYGPDHIKVASVLNNLAVLLKASDRLVEAERLHRKALAIDERSYGPEHTKIAIDLNNLALLLQEIKRLEEAEPLSQRQLQILLNFSRATGHEHPFLSTSIDNHKGLLEAMGLTPGQVHARLDEIGRPFSMSLGGREKDTL
jgi:tetratricopeptide (TPR) repeat protein